jgi:FeS assembly SUF system regulator
MIRLKKLTDYSFVLLSQFVLEPGIHAARPLSGRTRIPLATVSKVLKMLAQAGLLEPHRGTHGGYTLTRPPGEVSVLEILAALEGPIALTDCGVPEPGLCDIEAYCPVRSNWILLSRTVTEALRHLTLQDLATEVQHTRLPHHRPTSPLTVLVAHDPPPRGSR